MRDKVSMLDSVPPPRMKRGGRKTRAKSPEAQENVRAALIAAGRTLLASKGSKDYSLRAVAAAAGYSPGAVYKYFADHRALLLAIREQDMLAAVIEFERLAASEPDPAKRVKALFLGATKYWLGHFEQFETLFSLAPSAQVVRDSQGVPFGRSAVVTRSYAAFDTTVRAYLKSQGNERIDPKLAVDTLIAAVHGTVWFPHATRTMEWSEIEPMVDALLDAIIARWGSS